TPGHALRAARGDGGAGRDPDAAARHAPRGWAGLAVALVLRSGAERPPALVAGVRRTRLRHTDWRLDRAGRAGAAAAVRRARFESAAPHADRRRGAGELPRG